MHSRSDDPVADALSRAGALIVEAVRASPRAAPVVLLDGRSGAGKTSLARRVAGSWPRDGGVQVIAMDSIYPGWDGLDPGVDHAVAHILEPHRRGATGRWRRWDWQRSVAGESVEVDPSRAVLIEGSGILTPEAASLADIRVWVESDETARKARALDRDGDRYRPHWERWAAQERQHIQRDRPHDLADLVVEVP